MRRLEICTGSIESVLAAKAGGAQRVELCSALNEGGVTPSWGLLKAACKVEGIKKHVLIRPRGGDFLYSDNEIQFMIDDIIAARELGADGVAIGALTKNADIDMSACRRMVEAATLPLTPSPEGGLHSHRMSVTFHRAFDMVRDADKALEDVISLGCDRILTSGLMPTAWEGREMLRHLVEKSAGRIIIMPGSGVSSHNAADILSYTGASEIHASARSARQSLMEYRNPTVTMGAKDADEYARKETDPEEVKKILETFFM